MPSQPVPLQELAVAVQDAVKRVLGQHGAVTTDKLWVGFVAPENLANQETASKLAAELGKEAGVHAQGSVAQLSASPSAQPATRPGHIIGLVFSKQ